MICLTMIGSTKRVISDCVTTFSGQVTSHPEVTDPRIISNSSSRQTSFIRTTKPTQEFNSDRHKLDQSKGKLFIISAIAQI